jgi:diacylglycerol O-acyltransferase
MQQLSGLDAAFLYSETPNVPMHIGGLSIWDPSTAPGGKVSFRRIVQTINERAHLAPHLRQRLFEVPLSADFPYWVRDATFDQEYHVRHVVLPEPGDWRQLCQLIARLHAQPLDRTRPLWETYVIDGLDNIEGVPAGSFALFSKTHHAAVDGASSNDIGTALCDPSPSIRKIEGADTWQADTPPKPWELAAFALRHNALKPLHYLEFIQKAIPAWTRTLEGLATGRLHRAPRVPRTRFNSSVSPQRVFEGVTFKLDEIRAIKNTLAGTINDVMLAVCSGALRHYFLEKGELPDTSLVAMCPVDLRDHDETKATGGNLVASMAVALHTEIADPRERLLAIHAETRNAKELATSMDPKVMLGMSEFTPTTIAALNAQITAAQGLANITEPEFNTVITNIPGPQLPIFSNGAQHVRGWGTGPSVEGNGLFHSVGSYCGEVTVGISCCRVMMPDPENYADCLRDSFAELRLAVLGEDRRRPAVKKNTRPGSATGRASAKKTTGDRAPIKAKRSPGKRAPGKGKK